MHRQYGSLYLTTGDETVILQEERNAISEGQIQEFIYNNPELLPIDEIEPFFQPLIPICMELSTPAGPADVFYVNDKGLITLVECKLWRNPDARRHVVAQILDYAKEINNWSYEDLQEAVYESTGDRSRTIAETVGNVSDELDESAFIDAVTSNLRRGRYLLLIVGDGIRQSVERISEYLNNSAHLNFSLALVETKVYRCPQTHGGGYIFQPRVLAQTVEIERAVFRIEDERIIAHAVNEENSESGSRTRRRTRISEQAFYEEIEDNVVTRDLRALIGEAEEIGLELEPGQNSLKLKYRIEDNEFNFMVFNIYNEIRNYGIASSASIIGHPEIGDEYLNRLASIFEGAYVRTNAGRFHWTVRSRDGGYITIPQLLAHKDQWLSIVGDTINQIDAAIIK